MTDKLIERDPNIYGARKRFHDWLDTNRPWARPNCNVYEMMEEIVDTAAAYFRGHCRPTQEDMQAVQTDLLRITALLTEHPEGYEGPCNCLECHASD